MAKDNQFTIVDTAAENERPLKYEPQYVPNPVVVCLVEIERLQRDLRNIERHLAKLKIELERGDK